MELRILGMNGPFPAPGGAASGYYFREGDTGLILDLGSGTLSRLTLETVPEDMDALLISHWHADHTSDLQVLGYRLQALGKTMPLYGPGDKVSFTSQAADRDSAFTVTRVAPGDRFRVGELSVEVFGARHPVPSVMYRITGREGIFCYTGDTNLFPGLSDFARGADWLLADAAFDDRTWGEGKPHLSGRLCGQIAREAGVKKLILTHLNPLVDHDAVLREAREAFPDCLLARQGMRIGG